MVTAQQTQVGLFPASFEIGTDLFGAPHLRVDLLVDAPTRRVTGMGKLGWAVSPPVAMTSKLEGDYSVAGSTVVVVLTGYPVVHWPPGGGIGPVLMPNLEIRMVLDGWSGGGTASVRFTTDGVNWTTIDNVPVKPVSPFGASGSSDGDAAASGAAASDAAASLQEVILDPSEAEAHWKTFILTVHVSGREEGVADIEIVKLPMQLWPPRFQVRGQESPAIGNFPYEVSASFAMSRPDEIYLVDKTGNERAVKVSG